MARQQRWYLPTRGGNYAGQKLMGTDAGFSWRSIAASAVGSLVSAKVTPGLVDKMRIQDKFGYDFASGMTGGMVSAGVRSSFGQTLRQGDYMAVVADAFGNALGSSIANSAAQERELEMRGRISTDMRGVNNRLSEQMETATDGVAQSHLDRMLGAATDRNLLDATTRFQTQLDVDYARWESAARARVAAEMAARARATSAAPAGYAGASFDYSGFIADLASRQNGSPPYYRKPVAEQYGIGRMPAMSLANDPRLDPVTRQPLPQMQAADDTWTLARARGERELKARQNMAALDERVGAALAFFGPTYDNGTISGQLINPITGQRVSNSQREEAIGDILGITTMFVGPSALGQSAGAGRFEVPNPVATTSEAASALRGAQLNEHLRQVQKYGEAGFRELQNGRVRYYGEITPARNPGEMVGARLVREWDPSTTANRTWYETLDHTGRVRSVAPKPVTEPLNHRIFDADGNYTGRR